MKTTRKILSVLLVLAMVSAMFIVGASAEGENTAYQANAYTHIPQHEGDFADLSGKTVTYLSADGADEDTNPDLLIAYGNYGDGKAPVWNYNYNKSTYYAATYTTKINCYSIAASGTEANGYKTEEDGTVYREKDGAKFYAHRVYLGLEKTANAAKYFPNGIGVMPTASTSTAPEGWEYVMFNVDGYDYFYSACGMTGSALNPATSNANRNNKLIFEVYGSPNVLTSEQSADASFVLLAASEAIGLSNAGEFNVDVSDYKTLKLVCRIDDANGSTKNYGCNAAWGDPCVYNLNDFSVNYDGNGGKTADDKTTLADTENVTGSNEVSATITADACTFEKDGYLFDSWNTKADGTGDKVAAGDAVALTVAAPSVTLYAQWKEKPADVTYYKVTFVADGATVSEIEVEAGKDATLPTVPAKEGYNGAWDKDGKAIAADTTITAVYTKKTYTVTFVIPGLDNTTATVEHGADATLPTIPAKSGLTGTWDKDGKNITADTTITASYVRTPITVKPSTSVKGLKGATNKQWLSDLYAKDIKDAATHTLVDNPKYVAYSHVQKNAKFPNGRIFSVNVNFFNRAGVYTADGYTHLEKGTLEANGKTYKNTDIVLGKSATIYEKGLSMQPNATVVFDLTNIKGDYFYAVAGMTGMANNTEYMVAKDAKKLPQDLTFAVYGSTASTYSEDAKFELLASCEHLTDAELAEFNVNIEGYKYLKLVCKTNVASSNNEAAWANLCIYTADTAAATADGFSMTAVAAAIVAATSVVALVVARKKFF